MARQIVIDTYGEEGYTRGLTVYTTLRKDDQTAAYMAVRRGVADFALVVPCDYIPRIQEVQASISHVIREILEVLSNGQV